jgi:hypothetical protein
MFAMTLRENERRRLQRMASLEDDKILRFRQWCEVNGFSERTGRRVLASGDGPVVTRLSDKIIGVTIGNNRKWQAARERT